MSEYKLCKDCKHFKPDLPYFMLALPILGWAFALVWVLDGSYYKFGKCRAIKRPNDNYISGDKGEEYYYASIMRFHYAECGTGAKLYEPKTP